MVWARISNEPLTGGKTKKVIEIPQLEREWNERENTWRNRPRVLGEGECRREGLGSKVKDDIVAGEPARRDLARFRVPD